MKIKLSELAATKSGLVLSRKKASLQSKIKRNYNVVSLKSFNENGIYNHSHVESFVADDVLKDDYLVKKGDILIRLREPNFAIYIDKDYDDLVVSSLMVLVSIDTEKISPQYLAYYLNSDFSQSQLLQDATIGAIKMIKVSNIQNLKIVVPSIEKQKLLVDTINTFGHEEVLLQNLIAEKQKLKKSVFNTVIKEDI